MMYSTSSSLHFEIKFLWYIIFARETDNCALNWSFGPNAETLYWWQNVKNKNDGITLIHLWFTLFLDLDLVCSRAKKNIRAWPQTMLFTPPEAKSPSHCHLIGHQIVTENLILWMEKQSNTLKLPVNYDYLQSLLAMCHGHLALTLIY